MSEKEKSVLDIIADAVGMAEGTSDKDRKLDLITARVVLEELAKSGYIVTKVKLKA